MRLKRLELAGFKSFVDPTSILLDAGVHAIVGPNGSGKSNIVDAIRWALGEHSAKHLRGGVLEDLIFQGSEARPPASVAEVELLFEVAPGELPPPYEQISELHIRRRLLREGPSETYLNGKPARLRDVLHLFLDTGSSARAYAIVEQGAIARMITAKPEERRIWLEEAAGVAKYRARRKEAELKMAAVRGDLERVRDLWEEVRRQCRSLKQQAARAERFRAMQEELEKLQAFLFHHRFAQQQKAKEEAEKAWREAVHALQAVRSSLAKKEKELHQAKERLLSLDNALDELQRMLQKAEEERRKAEIELERRQHQISLIEQRIEMLSHRIEERKARCRELKTQIETLKAEQQTLCTDGSLEEAAQAAERAFQLAEAQWNEALKARDEAMANWQQAKAQMEALAREQASIEKRLARLAERKSEQQKRLVAMKTSMKHLADEIEKASEKAEKIEKKLKETEKRRLSLEAASRTRKEGLDRLNEQARAKEMALHRLQGEIERLQALSAPAKDIQSCLEKARAMGAVALEDLALPEAMLHAVLAAVGRDAAVAWPVRNEQAEAFMAEMDGQPMAFVFAQNDPAKKPSSLADAIGLAQDHPWWGCFAAIRLVKDAKRASMEDAPCVDRQGWRLDATGVLYSPSFHTAAKRLRAVQELKGKEKEKEELEREIEALRSLIEKEKASADLEQNDLFETKREEERMLREWQRLSSQIEHLRARKEQEEMLLARLEEEKQELAKEEKDLTTALMHTKKIDQGMLDRHADALAKAKEHAKQAEEKMKQAQSAFLHAKSALSTHRQRLKALQAKIDEQQKALAKEHRRWQQDEEALEQEQEKKKNMACFDPLIESLKVARSEAERIRDRIEETRARQKEAQRVLSRLEKELAELRREENQCSIARHAKEMELEHINEQLLLLSEEIHARFGCAPEALPVEEGEDPNEVQAKASALEERIARFGPVNMLAIKEFREAERREAFLREQIEDLEASLATLSRTIERIDRTTRELLVHTFEEARASFAETFPRLFGGGRAEIRWNGDDPLVAGVEIVAEPPGKRLQDLSLLSGGEKALSAAAFIFALMRIRPAPFCVLDEIDAPLDDANVARLCGLIRELSDQVQFLVITHNKITMQHADRIIGVAMPTPGVSRIVSVELEKAIALARNRVKEAFAID